MIKIPTYIDCLAKVVSYLGLDYSEEENKTGKFRVKEQKTFFNQGKIYTEQYVPKILDLFAGKNEEKRELVNLFLKMSENLARDLTSEDYRTLANNKRAMWGLCIFYYIPHISCLLAIYKKEFGLPDVLIENNFMLPFFNDKRKTEDKIKTPIMRLSDYCQSILNEVNQNSRNGEHKKEYGLISSVLEGFIENINKNPKTTPSYKTLHFILSELSSCSVFENKIAEFSLMFRTAIVSANVYFNLLKLFEEPKYVMSLIDYFNRSLKSVDLFFKGVNADNEFDYFFYKYPAYYELELAHINASQKRFHFDNHGILVNFPFDEIPLYKEEIFELFRLLLVNTTSDIADDLFELNVAQLNIENLINITSKPDADKSDCESLLYSLHYMDSVERMYSSSRILNSDAERILRQGKNYQCHDHYKDQYLYCDALNDLAKNDFQGAIKKLEDALEVYNPIRSKITQIKIAEKLIPLKIIDSPYYRSLNNLNKYIKIVVSSNLNDPSCKKNGERKLDAIYRQKVFDIIKSFNKEGYARYEGIECVKINPFEKVEQFVNDFYALYDENQNTESELKVKEIIEKLTSNRGAKYKLDSNLVALNSFKPLDVFEPDNFMHIAFFYFDSKIESENISKLKEDFQTLEWIFSTLSTLCAPYKPTLLPYITHVKESLYNLHIREQI